MAVIRLSSWRFLDGPKHRFINAKWPPMMANGAVRFSCMLLLWVKG